MFIEYSQGYWELNKEIIIRSDENWNLPESLLSEQKIFIIIYIITSLQYLCILETKPEVSFDS